MKAFAGLSIIFNKVIGSKRLPLKPEAFNPVYVFFAFENPRQQSIWGAYQEFSTITRKEDCSSGR